MMMMERVDGAAAAPPRLSASPLTLLRDAAGSPADLASKIARLGRTLGRWWLGGALGERLDRLVALGIIDHAPTGPQLVAGSADMVRFWISPAAADYYRDKGIGFGFHQVLRVLDDPASMIDPIGFFSERDVIIGHLLQVVHANPRYDLQLLASHEGGLEALEAQTAAMLDGTHPRARSIGAIVEDAGYHERLLAYVRAFRADPAAPPPVRENVAGDPAFAALERTFGTLPAAMRYFCRLPPTALGAARHLLTVRAFPVALAEPAVALAA